MFKTTAIDTLKQDKKCQACWYIILSTMSGSTTTSNSIVSSAESVSIIDVYTVHPYMIISSNEYHVLLYYVRIKKSNYLKPIV